MNNQPSYSESSSDDIISNALSIPDIRYELIGLFHPYYAQSLCRLNKDFCQSCDDLKYEILRTWVYPDKSLNDLHNEYPNLIFNHVVELALVYNPIPESVKYYDYYTLFYHACRTKQEDPTIYLRNSKDVLGGSNNLHMDEEGLILWICYKFNRVDVISRLLKEDNYFSKWEKDRGLILIDMISIKEGKKPRYKGDPSTRNRWSMESDFRSYYPMFSFEECIEIITIAATFKDDHMGLVFDYFAHNSRFLGSLLRGMATILGEQKVYEIVNKYLPSRSNEIVTQDYMSYSTANELGIGEDNAIKYRNTPTLAVNHIPEIDLGVYYITSGRFDLYVKWLGNGNSLPNNIKDKFFGMNEFGYTSFNKSLIDRRCTDRTKKMPYRISPDRVYYRRTKDMLNLIFY